MKCYMGHFGTVETRESLFFKRMANANTMINIGSKMNPRYVDRNSSEGRAFLAEAQKLIKNNSLANRISLGLIKEKDAKIPKKVVVSHDDLSMQDFFTEADMENYTAVDGDIPTREEKKEIDKAMQSDMKKAETSSPSSPSNKGKLVGGLAVAGLAAYFLMKD